MSSEFAKVAKDILAATRNSRIPNALIFGKRTFSLTLRHYPNPVAVGLKNQRVAFTNSQRAPHLSRDGDLTLASYLRGTFHGDSLLFHYTPYLQPNTSRWPM